MKVVTFNDDILDIYYFLKNNVVVSYDFNLHDIEYLEKYHVGSCIDFNNYIYKKLTSIGYKVHNIFIIINPKLIKFVHTFSIIELNNKFYLIEAIKKELQGIMEFDSFDEAILFIKEKYLEADRYTKNKIMEIIEVDYNEEIKDFKHYIYNALENGKRLTDKYVEKETEIKKLSNDHAKYMMMLDIFEREDVDKYQFEEFGNEFIFDWIETYGIPTKGIVSINKNTKEIIYLYVSKYCDDKNLENKLRDYVKNLK